MSYRNARLANGFLSLDMLFSGVDMSKVRVTSDQGAGVRRIVATIDYDEAEAVEGEKIVRETRERIIAAVRQRFRRAGMGYLMPTFLAICRNGRHRYDSIAEIARERHIPFSVAKTRYFVHRKKIIKLLMGQ